MKKPKKPATQLVIVNPHLIHTRWKSIFWSHPYWRNYDPNEPIRMSKHTFEKEKKELIRCQRFKRRLLSLCDEFDFNPLKPIFSENDHSENRKIVRFEPGLLTKEIAQILAELTKKTDDWKNEIVGVIEWLSAANALQARVHGPIHDVPDFIAEMVLAGLSLHKGNTDGISLIRNFFSMGGEFPRKFIKIYPGEPRDYILITTLCGQKGVGTNNDWARQVRLTLKRSLKNKVNSKNEIAKMIFNVKL